MVLNLAFYVSGKATRLNRILNTNNSELIKSIKLVFSDSCENIYLKEKLDRLKITCVLYNYKDISISGYGKNLIVSNMLLEALNKKKIDYCISFGSHILKGELLNQYKNRIINFHPSILPAFPGLKAIDQAIKANANVLGNTAHFIDAGVDTGPIILQSIMHSNVFHESGYDAVLDVQVKMFYILYELLKEDKIRVVENKVFIEGADYNFFAVFPNIRLENKL